MDLKNVGGMLSGGADSVKDKIEEAAAEKIGKTLKDKGIKADDKQIKDVLEKGEKLVEGMIKKDK